MALGTVWDADTWDADAWADGTWADAEAPAVQEETGKGWPKKRGWPKGKKRKVAVEEKRFEGISWEVAQAEARKRAQEARKPEAEPEREEIAVAYNETEVYSARLLAWLEADLQARELLRRTKERELIIVTMIAALA